MLPWLTSSSPAMRRRQVDLPQPEGPTRTRNSLSLTSIVMSFTAVTSPNRFETCSRVTLDIEKPPPKIPEIRLLRPSAPTIGSHATPCLEQQSEKTELFGEPAQWTRERAQGLHRFSRI